jgi:hypothetical protein
MESQTIRELLVSFAKSVDLKSQQWQPRKDARAIEQLVQDASSLGFLETSKEWIVSTTTLGQSMRREMSRIFANYGTMI